MNYKIYIYLIILLTISLPITVKGQGFGQTPINIEDDDISVGGGGGIFSNFNEDIESSQVMEDERYYRYGRFFSASIGFGITSFTGNRGIAYEDEDPSYYFAVHQFLDFNSAYGLGIEYSKHHFFIDQDVHGYDGDPPGLIEVSMLRFFLDFRHYIDTTDLGTAVTFSNPYFVGRFEYWYQTNKFVDQSALANEKGGGIGIAAGVGLEFPVKLKESYIGVEFLVHKVNLVDKYTQKYRPKDDNPNGFGYDDLTGTPYTAMVTYVSNW